MSNIFISEHENFVIEISDDKFSAFLTVKTEDEFLNESELVDLIKKTKILIGFEEAKEYVSEKKISKGMNNQFPLAIGNKPKEPEVEFSLLCIVQGYAPTTKKCTCSNFTCNNNVIVSKLT